MARCRSTKILEETMGDEGITLVCDKDEYHPEDFHLDELHELEWRDPRVNMLSKIRTVLVPQVQSEARPRS